MTKAYRTDRMCDDDVDPVDVYEETADPDSEDAEFDDDGDLAEMNDISDDAFDWPDDDDEDAKPLDADDLA